MGALSIPVGHEIVKISLPVKSEMTDRPQFLQPLNRYNSAADCLISLVFGTEFDHVTATEIVQRQRVKDPGHRG